jgi:hypothetical protein
MTEKRERRRMRLHSGRGSARNGSGAGYVTGEVKTVGSRSWRSGAGAGAEKWLGPGAPGA